MSAPRLGEQHEQAFQRAIDLDAGKAMDWLVKLKEATDGKVHDDTPQRRGDKRLGDAA